MPRKTKEQKDLKNKENNPVFNKITIFLYKNMKNFSFLNGIILLI